ncbi:MAG: LuxR C-terminal-related transcriptional regulator [Gaiellaceae bacterium MAG52_C11]|nr:LuxR C-terminal-related transcriptional regulator [Candidatus Gaiellasilicea maunaloa]
MSSSRIRLTQGYPYFARVVSVVAARLPQHVRDECESEALCAMVEAADEWRDGGAPFRLFVAERIKQRMLDEARRADRVDRSTGSSRNPLSLSSILIDEEAGGETLADRLEATGPAAVDPHSRAVALERLEALAALPARLRLALTLDRADASSALGVSVGHVDRFRRTVRDALDAENRSPADELAASGIVTISPRELTVLRSVSGGATNAEIADDLGVSIETIKSHVKQVLTKLEARSRAHAVHLAWEADWWDVAAA